MNVRPIAAPKPAAPIGKKGVKARCTDSSGEVIDEYIPPKINTQNIASLIMFSALEPPTPDRTSNKE